MYVSTIIVIHEYTGRKDWAHHDAMNKIKKIQ